jgi:AraC family transcriptional regulator
MARMNRTRPLFASELVHVERFDHPHGDPVPAAEEPSTRFSANFVESGAFTVSAGRTRWEVGRDSLFVTAPGRWYGYDHADEQPCDVCLRVVFDDRWREDLADVPLSTLASSSPVVPLTNRRAYLRDRLLHHIEEGAPLSTVESVCGEILMGAAEDSRAARPLYRRAQLSWYAKRIDRARELFEQEYACDQSLHAVSRSVGMSVFHFARIFRELTGVPPHQYLIRRRLRAALDALGSGATVTDACFASGFSNLSHFIRMFRARYGVSPSNFDRLPPGSSSE